MMQSILIQPDEAETVVSPGSPIRCSFEVVNRLACSLWDCCFKVSLEGQVARFDIAELGGEPFRVDVDFRSRPQENSGGNMLCQLFQGDRLVAVYEHKIRIA